MRWESTPSVREMPNAYSFSADQSEDLGTVRRIILKQIFKNRLVDCGLISSDSG
jgi:hypothetical protein